MTVVHWIFAFAFVAALYAGIRGTWYFADWEFPTLRLPGVILIPIAIWVDYPLAPECDLWAASTVLLVSWALSTGIMLLERRWTRRHERRRAVPSNRDDSPPV